jgi:hypothetical protein
MLVPTTETVAATKSDPTLFHQGIPPTAGIH